jgi:hypothetical protein
MSSIAKGMAFPTMNDCRAFCQLYAKQNHFAVATQDSSNVTGYLLMECKHHRQYRKAKAERDDEDVLDLTATKSDDLKAMKSENSIDNVDPVIPAKKRNTKTGRLGCTVRFYFQRGLNKNDEYKLTDFDLEHNHPLASSIETYHEHRKLTDVQLEEVRRLIAAKVPPRAIVDLMNSGDHDCNMIAKDVANINQRRFAGMDNGACADMIGFFNYLEGRGYEVRWRVDSDSRTVAIFFYQ